MSSKATEAGEGSRTRWLTPQFTLKSLLVVMLLVGCSLGAFSLGRKQGRRDAQPEIDALNQECSELMGQSFMMGGTIIAPFNTTKAAKVYDLTKPEDRKAYRQDHAIQLNVY